VSPEAGLRLQVGVNTREHESLYGIKEYPFEIESTWYAAKTTIRSFEPEELFGTKLRALLQRRKSRDLFDLGEGLRQLRMDPEKLIACFRHCLDRQGLEIITRAVAEERMLDKLNRSLTEDIAPLLPAGVNFGEEQALRAFERIWLEVISRMSGEPWRLSEKNIERVRSLNPGFLRGDRDDGDRGGSRR
jgi:hypothetical protein